jgi:hypothetical protein
MSLAQFQGVISEFGGRLGAPEMAADDEGYVGLTFDGVETHLQYDAERDEVVAFTRLVEVDAERAAEVYGMLLGANMFWQGTGGATLSVEPDSGMAFMADRRSLASLSVEELNDWIEPFLDMAAMWRKRITDANAGGPLVEVDLPDDGGGAPRPSGPNLILKG